MFKWFGEKPEKVHLDGKVIKGSCQNLNAKQSFVLLVSAYSSDLKRTLGIEAIETSKESEIEAFREIIKKLNLKGVIITGDALHATIETMKTIKDSGNEYILQVKRNRPDWYKECERICSEEAPEDKYRDPEKNKGRVEIREISVYEASEKLKSKKLGILKIIKVVRNNKTHYYFSSVAGRAKDLGKTIREHWSVETMHYLKDVVMKEDEGKSKDRTFVIILSILRAFALNVIFRAGFTSPTAFTRQYSHKIDDLLNFI